MPPDISGPLVAGYQIASLGSHGPSIRTSLTILRQWMVSRFPERHRGKPKPQFPLNAPALPAQTQEKYIGSN